MALKMPIQADAATTRFLCVARAIQASEQLPKASAATLVGEARAVRLFAEAREFAEARGLCDGIDGWLGEEGDQALIRLVKRHTDAVRQALR